MKRFKLIFAVIICVLVACPLFAGCASVASYVKGSGKCTTSYDKIGSTVFLTVNYGFDIDVKKEGDYTVKFDLEIYDGEATKENLVETLSSSKDFSSDGGVYTVKDSAVTVLDNELSNAKILIANVQITRNKEGGEYKAYAIGFGSAGGALLLGATVYFIVDKLVISKKEDN